MTDLASIDFTLWLIFIAIVFAASYLGHIAKSLGKIAQSLDEISRKLWGK